MNAAMDGDLAAVLLLVTLVTSGALVVATLWWWPLVLAMLVAGILEGHMGVDLGIETGYFRILALDLVSIVAGGAGIVRLLSAGRLDRLQLFWIAVTLVLAAAFLHGAAAHGPATAGIFYRRFFYLTTATLYVMTFPWPPADLERFAQLWLGAAAALAGFAALLWLVPDIAAYGPMATERFRFAFEAQRVLPAASAFLLSQAALIGIAAWSGGKGSSMLKPLAIACLLVSILLIHRSVWVSTAVGLLLLTTISTRALVPVVAASGVAAFAGLAVVALIGGLGHDLLASPVSEAVGEVLSSDSSLAWRVTGWDILINRTLAGGVFSTLVGNGFGVGYERLIGWARFDFSPHNVYVEIFINSGLVGASLWTLFHLVALFKLWFGRFEEDETVFDRRAAVALLASLIAFGLPYTPSPEQGIMLGVIAVIAGRSLARQTIAAPAAEDRA